MTEQEINPFDASSYTNDLTISNEPTNSTELPQEAPTTVEPSTEPIEINPSSTTEQKSVDSVVEPVTNTAAEAPIETKIQFEWENEAAKNIYDSLVSGNISEVADVLYEQKVLSEIDKMDESDILKLKLAYDYPDLTPQDIEEEFNSKYGIDKDFDESNMTDEEIASTKKLIEKQEKVLARELKKDVREAKDFLQTLKQDISFPDILSKFQEVQSAPVNTEEVVSNYLKSQEEEQDKAYQQSRQMFENSIEDGLKSFEGFNVNYKDEDVQFDGKYSLTQEEKANLQNDLKAFDLESFYGPRYYKDGKYDTKQLAEDVYFLNNREKIVSAMVTQAVNKAKSDMLKGMKNIDYNNSPRPAATLDASEMDKMVDAMFRL